MSNLRRDMVGEAEWFELTEDDGRHFYIRLETQDAWFWYELDDYTNHLIEVPGPIIVELEEARNSRAEWHGFVDQTKWSRNSEGT